MSLRRWQINDILNKKFASQIEMLMAFRKDSALISVNKNIYGFGTNKNGLLGLPNSNYSQPEKVKALYEKKLKNLIL